jgi:hypothetical protein
MAALKNALIWLLSQYGLARRNPRRQPWVHIGPVARL